MPQTEREEQTRYARRWADVAWAREWHAHAIEVLDRAIELNPDSFKLYRKRGAFYLLCPDATVQDSEQAVADLRKACDLAGWREDFVRWVVDLLRNSGEVTAAKEFVRDFPKRSPRAKRGQS
jgi:hypothetical protein